MLDESLVAHAGDGWEALELAAGIGPDVVLTHPDLPGLDGTEVTLRLRHVCPEARVVIIAETVHESELRSVSALGADAYIDKDCSAHRLLSTIAELAGTRAVSIPAGRYGGPDGGNPSRFGGTPQEV